MPTVRANGLDIEYEAIGDPGKPAIVLIMGLGVQLILWPDELVERIAAAGFRVIRFDNRDAGLSTSLDHLGSPSVVLEYGKYLLGLPVTAPYLIEDMAKDTAGFLDALGIERAHLVGASMGGMIAQNVAADYPQKVKSLTSMMSTTGNRKLPLPEVRAMRAMLQPPAKKGDFEAATRRFVNVLSTIGSRTFPWEREELRAFCERHVRRSQNPEGQLRQFVAIAGSGDRTATVRRIKAPTLVIHGREDPLLPLAAGEATVLAIREGGGTAELVVMDGMGHDLPKPLLPQLADLIAAHCRRAEGA